MSTETSTEKEEMGVINELRQRLEGYSEEVELLQDNQFLLNFLKSRNFNLDDAEVMLRRHLQFRKKHDVKTIAREYEFPEVVEKYFSHKLIGYDKEGSPVRFYPVGNTDINGLASSLKHEDIIKTIILVIENGVAEVRKQSKRLKRNVNNVVCIADVGNLSFAQMSNKKSAKYFIAALKILMHNYPEIIKAFYIINASYYFTYLYSFLTTILPQSILERSYVYSDDSYKKDLLRIIDADTLPAFLGGNKTDPDGNPLCLTFIDHAGTKVPESYYISNSKQMLSDKPGVQYVMLTRGASLEINLEVVVSESCLEWEFETQCRDIGFGIFYQETADSQQEPTAVLPIKRMDTEEYPEEGLLRCEKTGIYIVVFDNSYSWLRGKEIYYKIEVVLPEKKMSE